MSGSVHRVIPVRKASKILHLFNPHLSWWSISSVFVLNIIRLSKIFKCFPKDTLQIRITDSNEVSFFNNYSLVATINHSGSLNNGSYWAIIKDDTTNQLFFCNDKVAFEIKADDLNRKTSYVFFYVSKWFNFYFIFHFCYFYARRLYQFGHCLLVWQPHT